MKYEIRIISEEDTVKSKPYDDYFKAVDIAKYIYENMVDIDYGDEVVVVEEDKPKKYLWANSKTLDRPLVIGDRVKIKDNGQTYSTYEDFMLAHATKELCCRWNQGKTPNNNDKIYTVRTLAMHGHNGETLAIIEDENEYNLSVYIIGVRGLEIVE